MAGWADRTARSHTTTTLVVLTVHSQVAFARKNVCGKQSYLDRFWVHASLAWPSLLYYRMSGSHGLNVNDLGASTSPRCKMLSQKAISNGWTIERRGQSLNTPRDGQFTDIRRHRDTITDGSVIREFFSNHCISFDSHLQYITLSVDFYAAMCEKSIRVRNITVIKLSLAAKMMMMMMLS